MYLIRFLKRIKMYDFIICYACVDYYFIYLLFMMHMLITILFDWFIWCWDVFIYLSFMYVWLMYWIKFIECIALYLVIIYVGLFITM